ncbi:MAG: 1-acyl-sn-glycerol-3-phosphate acyltransferase [Candidatus Obscuribacterales bacterium]|jgi:1-acyl-sn-glycerol-3-phosphate acyltransferase|nr:1-acyl-sn-glycerol-3-phosphate acyltransferase [Candidatus Obscuribacterales bacterium]
MIANLLLVIAIAAGLYVAPLLVALPCLLVAVLLFKFAPNFRNAREFSKQMQVTGFLADPPSDAGQRWMEWLTAYMCNWIVGKVDVVGLEKLDALAGKPIMICPDHPNMTDVMIVPHAIKRKARYMAAMGVMQAFGGFGGWVSGRLGAFGCDLRKGKGGPAREAAIKVLTTHQTLVMWPEGWTNMSPVMGAFKKGAVNIAKTASVQLGQTVYIFPVHLHYGRYPGRWIKSFRIDHQYWLVLLCYPFLRRGCKVIIGDPIASDTLDVKAAEALAAGKFAGDPTADLDDVDGVGTAYLKSKIEELKTKELADRAGR